MGKSIRIGACRWRQVPASPRASRSHGRLAIEFNRGDRARNTGGSTRKKQQQSEDRQQKNAEQQKKAREAEEAYKAALDKIPDKKPADPWKNMR